MSDRTRASMRRIETPRDRRERFPGKHEVYVYGQHSADGMGCIGCNWQTSRVLTIPEAVKAHDHVRRSGNHNHDEWVPTRDGLCPCGNSPSAANLDGMVSDDVVSQLADVLAVHGRVNPPGGKCFCGHEVPLGARFTGHQVRALLDAPPFGAMLDQARAEAEAEVWRLVIQAGTRRNDRRCPDAFIEWAKAQRGRAAREAEGLD